MKIIILFTLLCLTSCSYESYTIIHDVDVFDGVRIIENVDFVFSEDSIEGIFKSKARYRNATLIDGSGKTILPPLINAHVHVRTSENLKDALEVGIFGMLDMFSTDKRAQGLRVYNDSLVYAQFYSSNVGATPPGGHGTQFGINIPTINDSISPARFVKDRLLQNADYIKITHESSMSRLDENQLSELIDETHQHGKIAVAHISDIQNGIEVIENNVDGLAHMWYRNGSIASDIELEKMKEKGVFIIPTLSVIFKLVNHSNKIGLEESYLSIEQLQEEVQKMNKKGIPILAGTDSPNFSMDYTSQYFEELLLLKAAGLSEIEVLKSATVNIYDHFQLKDFSRLEKQHHASFILLSGAPHKRIEDIKNEKRIWKNGIEIS